MTDDRTPHRDTEHLVARGLDDRARQLGQRPPGSIADVFDRVGHRQARRRRSALVGSVAVVAIGIGGLMMVGRSDDRPNAMGSSGSTPSSSDSSVVTAPAVLEPVWRCSGEVVPEVADPGFAYFEQCQLLGPDDELTVVRADDEPTALPPTTTSVPDEFSPSTTLVSPGPPPPGTESVYIVEPGDYPSVVADKLEVPLEVLEAVNADNPNWDTFLVGAPIWIPMLDLATDTLTPSVPARFELGTHCGVRVLGRINGRVWRAEEGAGKYDWMPAEWPDDPNLPWGPIAVVLTLSEDEQTIDATANGRTVVYTSSGTEFEEADLCE